MHSRHRHLNVPIEIARTVIAVSEAGSFSKAGEMLSLSQPAVSSQIKRIQSLLGGSLFTRGPSGATPTQLGKLVLNQAHRMVEANDQMVRLGGAVGGPQPIRLGINTLFVRELLRNQSLETLANVVIHAGSSAEICEGLLERYIDIGCFLGEHESDADIATLVVKQWEEQFVWVRSPRFVLSHGLPIPLLTWPGEQLMVAALTKSGAPYRIAFNSPDHHAQLAAAEAGIGLTVIPRRLIPPDLVEAKEYYLPRLPPSKAYLCARTDAGSNQAASFLGTLSPLFSSAAVA